MPQQIDSAIKEMCGDAMSQTVTALAEKYGFDVDEANRFLDTSALKIVRKRGPSPKTTPEPSPKGKAKVKSDDKPKRSKTGYLLYADEVRAEVKETLISELEEDEKLKPQDVVKAIAAKWKAVDQSVRDEWNAKAKTPVTSDDESKKESDDEEVATVTPKKEAKTPEAPKKGKKGKKAEPEEELVSVSDDE